MEKASNMTNSNKDKNSNEENSIKNQSLKDTNATMSHVKPDIYKMREELKNVIRNSLIDIYEKLINTIDKKLQIDSSNEDQKDTTLENKYEKLLKELCPYETISGLNCENFIKSRTNAIKLIKNNGNKLKNCSDSLIDQNNSEEAMEENEPSVNIREPNIFNGISQLKNKITIKREKNKTLDYNYMNTNAENPKRQKKYKVKKYKDQNINMNSIELANLKNNLQNSTSSHKKKVFLRKNSKFQVYQEFNKTKYIRHDKKLKKILNIFSYQNSSSSERKKDFKLTNSNKNINFGYKKNVLKNTLSVQKSNGDLEFSSNLENLYSYENSNNFPEKKKFINKNPDDHFIPKNKSYNNEKTNNNIIKIPKFLTLKALDKFNKINIESEKKINNSSNGIFIKKLPCKLIQSTTEINIINSRNSFNEVKNTTRDKNVKKINNIILENPQTISIHNTLVAPVIAKKKIIRTINKINLQRKSNVKETKILNSEKIFKTLATAKTLQTNNKKNINSNPFKESVSKFNKTKKNSNFKNNISTSILVSEKSQKVISINYGNSNRNNSSNTKTKKNNAENKNNFIGSGKNLCIRNYINTNNIGNIGNNTKTIIKSNNSNNNLSSNKSSNKKTKNFKNINTGNSAFLKKRNIKG